MPQCTMLINALTSRKKNAEERKMEKNKTGNWA